MKCIALGIGDILINKLLFDIYQINDDIVINKYIIECCRNNSQEYYNFIYYLIKKLFNEDKIKIVNIKHIHPFYYFNNYKFKYDSNVSLKKYFDVNSYFDFEYIVFFTKIRMFNKIRYINKDKIKSILEKIKINKKIIILGERYVSDTSEKKLLNIQTFYNELLILKDNNEVIDLTEQELVCTPNINIFERDIKILANANCVIGIGIGGNFVMTTMFSNNYKFLIDNYTHPYVTYIEEINDPDKKIYHNLDIFLNDIKNIYDM